VHWSSPGFLENDGGGGEDGATRPGGGEGEGRGTVTLVTFSFCHSFLPLSLFFPTVFLSFLRILGQARWGQGESPRAAGGLFEGAADGERERTVHNIVMIQ